MSSSSAPRSFSPAMPIPPVFDLKEYLAGLYDRLDPKSKNFERPEQHKNLRALIKLYETGQRKDNFTFIHIINGEVVSEEEMWTTRDWCLRDVRLHSDAFI